MGSGIDTDQERAVGEPQTERGRWLAALVAWTEPLPVIGDRLHELTSYDDDADFEEVELPRAALIRHLEATLAREHSPYELKRWGYLAFHADGIIYEGESVVIPSVLASLAHPGTREILPRETIEAWIESLKREAADAGSSGV